MSHGQEDPQAVLKHAENMECFIFITRVCNIPEHMVTAAELVHKWTRWSIVLVLTGIPPNGWNISSCLILIRFLRSKPRGNRIELENVELLLWPSSLAWAIKTCLCFLFMLFQILYRDDEFRVLWETRKMAFISLVHCNWTSLYLLKSENEPAISRKQGQGACSCCSKRSFPQPSRKRAVSFYFYGAIIDTERLIKDLILVHSLSL